MRRSAIPILLLGVLALSARPALAQRYIAPSIGYTYGEAAGDCQSVWSDCPDKRTGYGIAFGTGAAIGMEEEITWTPDFLGESPDLEGSNVITLMTNLAVGIPIGPVRPYGSIGIGLVKAKAEFTVENFTDFSDTSFGYNYGAGVMVMLPAHLGFRVDFRAFRSSSDIPVIGGLEREVDLHFSRASIALVIH